MVERVSRTRTARRDVRTVEDTVVVVTASGVGLDENERTVLEVRKFETEPAYVRVNAGVTKNLGNYESLRVDVAITVPCYVEEIGEVQTRVADMVAERLDTEIENYMGKES